MTQPSLDLTARAADEVKTTTCYMCACRCGIRVHLKDGEVRYIDGNPDHPVNRGVLCAKGSAGIMQHRSPARLAKPLKRVGPRGEGRFQEIEWEEALSIATQWLADIRRSDPRRLAFFTGRDQSQSLTGWWAMQYGTPNFAAHGGFCSVNMAAAGLYTIGGSFWEFGEPDWEHTRYFLMFGVAEDHDSNPIKLGLGRLKRTGQAKVVSVNPVRTGYSAIADEWIGIRPGTDGLFVMALIHVLLAGERIDWDYLARYTNAFWLVGEDGLFRRDGEGRPVKSATAVSPDGTTVFELMARRYLAPEYAPEAVAAATGIPAATIRRIAGELAHAAFEQAIELPIAWTDSDGTRHQTMRGRPVSMHAMRGISAHSNGFHTCRAIHLLQLLLGSVDVPGGFRYEAPFPKPIPPGPKPGGKRVAPGQPLEGMPLGMPQGPEDLLLEADGSPRRIDKAYSWESPVAAHGLMHSVIHNAWKGDPYPIDTLFMYMANMAWNSSMNVPGTLKYLTDTNPDGSYRIPRVIYSDAYWSETVAYADLVLPDTTYLERWDCVSLLDRPISKADGPADAIRQPVVAPDRDVRPFQDVLLDLGARLGLPGFVREDGSPRYPGGYPDYLVNHERAPGIGPLAGWRGDGTAQGRGAPNPDQLQRYIDNGCFWEARWPDSARYYKFANSDYLEAAKGYGFLPAADPIVMQIYSEPLQKFRRAAEGHGPVQPPDHMRARVIRAFDPLPAWYAPLEMQAVDETAYPLHAITQRPMQMYHSWGSQNAWLRQITARNRLYVHPEVLAALGVADDGWVWIESMHGRVKAQVAAMAGVNRDTVWTWNAIGKRAGAWGLDPAAPEARQGFLLNHLIAELLPAREGGYRYANADPVTGQAAWYDLKVRLRPCTAAEAGESEPRFAPLPGPRGAAAPALPRGTASGLAPGRFREWLSGDHR
ncbi:MAG: molybdopterin oxidoreductase family protein [Thalassobaculales bacterium]